MDSRLVLVGRYPISICMACIMHMVWAVGLMLEPGAINATGLYTVLIVARDTITASAVFGSVAILAMVGLRTGWDRALGVLLILPQQIILWFSVVGAAHAMYLGQFADGVQRAHWFLIVDQLPVILIAVGHTAALLFIAENRHGGS
jgi:hypothetical protein